MTGTEELPDPGQRPTDARAEPVPAITAIVLIWPDGTTTTATTPATPSTHGG